MLTSAHFGTEDVIIEIGSNLGSRATFECPVERGHSALMAKQRASQHEKGAGSGQTTDSVASEKGQSAP